MDINCDAFFLQQKERILTKAKKTHKQRVEVSYTKRVGG